MRSRLLGCLLATVLVPVACGETARSPGAAGAAGTHDLGGAGAPEAGASAGLAGQSVGGSGAAGEPTRPGDGGGSGAGGAPAEGGAAGAAGAAPGDGGQAGADGEPQPRPPNLVFVTSEAYVLAELGGVAGADAACTALAKAAGREGTFVAWLSTSTVDAKARLGLASAWINSQGWPFADQAEELLAGSQVYYPISFDESGQRVWGRVATGTRPDGTAAPQNCQNYTSKSAAEAVVTGEPTGGSAVWTEASDSGACDDEHHLYCFQVDRRALIYPTPSQGRTVFVSAQPFGLGPQGRAAADAQCAAEAQAAQLSGTFVALLPSSTESALARLFNPSRPWVRPDGAVVAGATSALLVGPLQSAISEQADGSHVGGVAIFGADDLAQKATLHCEDWTDEDAAVPAVIHGVAGHTDERWYAGVTASCSESARVVCVEQ